MIPHNKLPTSSATFPIPSNTSSADATLTHGSQVTTFNTLHARTPVSSDAGRAAALSVAWMCRSVALELLLSFVI